MSETYTTREAAQLLGLKHKSVSTYIKNGIISAEKRGRDYLISAEELERFKQARRSPGRPQKEELRKE